MGWILAMFDLPVMTDDERKAATHFRNDLLDNGYLMIQYSVYARPCVSFEQLEMHIERIKKCIPNAGNVKLMFMTDEQWKKSYTVSGVNYRTDRREKNPSVPKQIEFWE